MRGVPCTEPVGVADLGGPLTAGPPGSSPDFEDFRLWPVFAKGPSWSEATRNEDVMAGGGADPDHRKAAVMIAPVLVLTQCPDCGGRRLMPVATRDGANVSCLDCRRCWHLARGRASVVDPETCPGCQFGRVMCVGHQAVVARHHDLPPTIAVDSTWESGPDDDLGWEDIESELCSSTREAGVQCSPPLS